MLGKYLSLFLLVACTADQPSGPGKFTQPDAGNPPVPAGWYKRDDTGGDLNCAIAFEFNGANYVSFYACDADGWTNIFLEEGTVTSDGTTLSFLQTASSCDVGAAPYVIGYQREPFALDGIGVLEKLPSLEFAEPVHIGCIYYDGFLEQGLVCHKDGGCEP